MKTYIRIGNESEVTGQGTGHGSNHLCRAVGSRQPTSISKTLLCEEVIKGKYVSVDVRSDRPMQLELCDFGIVTV